jgi:hypothetical protein
MDNQWTNSDGERVTRVLGKAGITEALLGSDGLTIAEFPTLLPSGKGYDFDGTDDLITIPDNDELSFTDGVTDLPLSIAGIVSNRETVTSNQVKLFGKLQDYVAYDGEYSFVIDESIGRAYFRMIDNGSGYLGRQSNGCDCFKPHKIVPFVSAYSGGGNPSNASQCAIYAGYPVDRADVLGNNAGAYSRMRNTSQDALFGLRAAVYFTGIIYEIRLYDIEVSPMQAKALCNMLYNEAIR